MPFKTFLLAALATSCLGTSACAQPIPPLDEDNSDSSIAELLNTGKSPYGNGSPDVYHVKPDDDRETRLMKQHINLLYYSRDLWQWRANAGRGAIPQLSDVQRRLSEARLDYQDDPNAKIRILQEALADAQRIEARERKRVKMGAANPVGHVFAVENRLRVELRLVQLEKKLSADK